MQTFGRYEILGTLGQGSFATVYRARDPLLDRVVALKALLPHLTKDAEDRQRFLAEGRAIAALRHPNIVTVYEAGEADGRPFFAMELVAGETLGALLARVGPLPLDQALRILIDLAGAIDCLHAAGLVHRDIKDSNVMLTPEGRVVLMDFGIALVLGRMRLTRGNYGLGTPETAAPEQVRGEAIGPAVDVYALGILAYQLFSGRLPFTGELAHVLYAHAHLPPPPLQDLRPGLPPGVYAAVSAALWKDPARRPASAGAFARQLSAASGAVQSDPENPTISVRRAGPRRRDSTPPGQHSVPLRRASRESIDLGTNPGPPPATPVGTVPLPPVDPSPPQTALQPLNPSPAAVPAPGFAERTGPTPLPPQPSSPPLPPSAVHFSGIDGDRHGNIRLRPGVAIFYIEHTPTRVGPFRVTLLDARGRVLARLVDVRQAYTGVRAYGVQQDGSYSVTVEARGPWTVAVDQPDLSAEPATDRAAGRGDGVAYLRLEAGIVHFRLGHTSWDPSLFRVTLLDPTGRSADRLVVSTGPFNGSADRRIEEAGTYILAVEAKAEWSVTVV